MNIEKPLGSGTADACVIVNGVSSCLQTILSIIAQRCTPVTSSIGDSCGGSILWG